jgi:hypothetical protein
MSSTGVYLKHGQTGDLVEILDVVALFDPCKTMVMGRYHAGEELQDAEQFTKSALIFPSGESLPRCWLDPDYKHV